ncbi:hypothetical protein PG985_004925 [Apiospora marii]|uniref:uncharacterized protein n=1 Tax=Apiospora marii TaxID=335849 RepID=UPI003130EF18
MSPASFRQVDSIDSIKKRYEEKEERRVQRELERQRCEQRPCPPQVVATPLLAAQDIRTSVPVHFGSSLPSMSSHDSTASMSQQFRPQPGTKAMESCPLHTNWAGVKPPSMHAFPGEMASRESQSPVSNLTAASMARSSPKDDGGTSCSNRDVEDDRSAGNSTDGNTKTSVPSPENTVDDNAKTKVASILSRADSTASAVPTTIVEEPATIIFSADTSQADNFDRSPPALVQKGTPALTNHITAGREKRCREGAEGADGTDKPGPAKRTRQEDTTARTLRPLPSRAPSAQRNGPSPGSLQTQPTRASKLRRVAPSSPKSFTSQSGRRSHGGNRPGRNSIQLLNPPQHPASSQTQSSILLERTGTPNSTFSGRNVQDAENLGASSTHQRSLRTPSHAAGRSAPICLACGFAPERLLQLTDSVEMLLASCTGLSDGETSRVMLQLLIGSIRDFVGRCPQGGPIAQKSGPLKLEHDYMVDATDQPRGAAEGSSHDESAGGTDDSDSQSDSAESDATSCSILDQSQQSKRRRWSDLEECRLGAWVKEGKDWSWIAAKLHRSEAAVSQHWTIMAQKDDRSKKKT